MKKLWIMLVVWQCAYGMGRGSEDYRVRNAKAFIKDALKMTFIEQPGHFGEKDIVLYAKDGQQVPSDTKMLLEHILIALGEIPKRQRTLKELAIEDSLFHQASAATAHALALHIKKFSSLGLTKLTLPIFLSSNVLESGFSLLPITESLNELSLDCPGKITPSAEHASIVRCLVSSDLCRFKHLKVLSLRNHKLEPRDWDTEYYEYEGALARGEQAKDPADHDTTGIHAMLKGLISKGMKLERLDLTGNNILLRHVPAPLLLAVYGANVMQYLEFGQINMARDSGWRFPEILRSSLNQCVDPDDICVIM